MWIVRYGGWTIWEGDDEEKAMEEYRACGPYGTICEVKGTYTPDFYEIVEVEE